jgi:hypothetical protein
LGIALTGLLPLSSGFLRGWPPPEPREHAENAAFLAAVRVLVVSPDSAVVGQPVTAEVVNAAWNRVRASGLRARSAHRGGDANPPHIGMVKASPGGFFKGLTGV